MQTLKLRLPHKSAGSHVCTVSNCRIMQHFKLRTFSSVNAHAYSVIGFLFNPVMYL